MMALPRVRRPACGEFVDLHPMDLSSIGEEQDVIMGGGDEEILHKIFFLDINPIFPFPPRCWLR